jgi:hypothetical protein
VQSQSLQFGNRIARLGKLPGEFLAREFLALNSFDNIPPFAQIEECRL